MSFRSRKPEHEGVRGASAGKAQLTPSEFGSNPLAGKFGAHQDHRDDVHSNRHPFFLYGRAIGLRSD
jgi:hypothetical protein